MSGREIRLDSRPLTVLAWPLEPQEAINYRPHGRRV